MIAQEGGLEGVGSASGMPRVYRATGGYAAANGPAGLRSRPRLAPHAILAP